MKIRKISQQNMLWIALGACCVVFVIYVAITQRMVDRTAPVFSVPEEPLKVSVYAEEADLLAGITAKDDRDGDVTSSIVVESISDIHDENQAVMTIAAFDAAGNVSKAKRDVQYTDYTGPRFGLSGPLIFREGTKFDVFDPVHAEDRFDGSLKDRIKGTLVSGETAVDRVGMYEVEFRVTNSLGDTEHLRVPVEVASSTSGQRRLALTSYLIYLKQGSGFDPYAYVTEGSRGFLRSVDSNVDPAVPGTYHVTYTDQSGESYGKTRLIVVVEE